MMQSRRIVLKPWKTLISLLIISVFFENMKIISVMGTSFKLTHIVFIFAIILGIYDRSVRGKDLLVGLFFLLLPCFPLYRITDTMEWFKSYVIYFIIVLFLVFGFRGFLREFKANYIKYIKLFIGVVVLAQVLGIIQFLCMNYFHYFFLRDFFGGLEYQKNIFNMSNGFYRAYSVYHEPSFFGLVSLAEITVLFVLGKQVYTKTKYYVLLSLGVLAIVVSFSASSVLIFLILLVAQQFVKEGPLAIKIISIIILAIFLMIMVFSSYLNITAMRIVTEVNIENSSGYERITTQAMYVQKTMQYYPLFGRGIGQEGNVDKVGIIGLYSATNNALAGVIVNFGLSSVFIIGLAVKKAIKCIKRNKKWIIIVLMIVGIYASSGAYISVDTFNMVVILCLVGCELQNKKRIQDKIGEIEIIDSLAENYDLVNCQK